MVQGRGWTPDGLEYEADPRQVERLLEELDLDGEGVKGVVTPGLKVQSHQAKAEKEIPESEHTRFRGLAARANFLSADRPDIIFAAKEICRFMANPTGLSVEALKRMGRYLSGRPRLVYCYPCQKGLETVDVYFYSPPYRRVLLSYLPIVSEIT